MSFPFPFVAGAASKSKLSRTYVTTWTSNANAIQYSATGVLIGTPSVDRYVVAVPMGSGNQTNGHILSATINGVNMDLVAGAGLSNGNQGGGIFITNTPIIGGTAANFTFTFNAAHARAALAIYTITGSVEKPTLISAGASKTQSPTGTITMPITYVNEGCIITSAFAQGSSSYTWSPNVTKDYQFALESGGSSFSGASTNTTTNATSEDLYSVTNNGNSSMMMLFAAWG